MNLQRRTEPIVGYRVWHYREKYLTSVSNSTQWPYYKPIEAHSFNGPENGIWAVKAAPQITNLSATYNAHIGGEVYLWGRVEEHEDGYRAQFAYPKRLWVAEDFDPVGIMELEDNYGVSVEFIPQGSKLFLALCYRHRHAEVDKVPQLPQFVVQTLKLAAQEMQRDFANTDYSKIHSHRHEQDPEDGMWKFF